MKKLMTDSKAKYSNVNKLCGSSEWTVTVKTMTGKQLECVVQSSDMIIDLKNMIQEMEFIPPDQQKILFGGNQCCDTDVISQVGARDGCTFHLVLRLRGGGGEQPLDPNYDGETHEIPTSNTYKEYMEIQNVDGSWDDKIISLIDHSSDEVYESASSKLKLKFTQQEVLSIMYTWIGIYQLNAQFPEQRQEWKLIEKKGILFLKSKFSLNHYKINCSLYLPIEQTERIEEKDEVDQEMQEEEQSSLNIEGKEDQDAGCNCIIF
ncbi:unnamed protein product [Moneuplotes crassus]|uniref:Ubiquitin-like domain-containing protein n=1 Tax=Euplotes crassus TaxID=5936 RepID=A0AAD1XT96_EUPCR|nr:unnamed protein product [Moneuplotes crassus]